MVTASGVSTTSATGIATTLMSAVPDLPPAVAVIVTGPGATAVTSPVLETVAVPPDEVLQTTVGVGLQLVLVTLAVSSTVEFTSSCAGAPVMATAETLHSGGGGGGLLVEESPQAQSRAAAGSRGRKTERFDTGGLL